MPDRVPFVPAGGGKGFAVIMLITLALIMLGYAIVGVDNGVTAVPTEIPARSESATSQ